MDLIPTSTPLEHSQCRLARRVLVLMYAAAAGSIVLGVQGQVAGQARDGNLVAAALCLAAGLLLVVLPPTRRILQSAVLFSVLVVGGTTAVSDPIGPTTFFYLWPILAIAYFFSRQMLAVGFVLMTATMMAALVYNDTVEDRFGLFQGTLASVVIVGLVVGEMHRRELGLRRQLLRAAETDPLTGLLNRRAFNPALEALLHDDALRAAPLAVVMIDVDHFKAFNDRRGHLVGDEALRRIARILEGASREGDLVSRFGGEEFAVVLPGATLGAARRYADRIATALALEPVPPELRLAVSVGITCARPSGETGDGLLSRADDALYAAKQAGRGRSAWSGPDQLIVVGAPIEYPSDDACEACAA